MLQWPAELLLSSPFSCCSVLTCSRRATRPINPFLHILATPVGEEQAVPPLPAAGVFPTRTNEPRTPPNEGAPVQTIRLTINGASPPPGSTWRRNGSRCRFLLEATGGRRWKAPRRCGDRSARGQRCCRQTEHRSPPAFQAHNCLQGEAWCPLTPQGLRLSPHPSLVSVTFSPWCTFSSSGADTPRLTPSGLNHPARS